MLPRNAKRIIKLGSSAKALTNDRRVNLFTPELNQGVIYHRHSRSLEDRQSDARGDG